MTLLSFSASSRGEHESGHWHSLAEFTASHAHFLTKAAAAVLSHFSCVQLCATPSMAAPQAPPSLGFSRQEHWSGLPFPSPMHEREK